MKVYFVIFSICLLYSVLPAGAQPPAHSDFILREDDSLYQDFFYREENMMGERLNRVFPALGMQQTIDNKSYDFDRIDRPAVIMIGYADCAPCRAQIPLLAGIANDAAYSGVDFIYITYDDVAYIRKELGKLQPGRLNIFSVNKDFILGSRMLAVAFPTVYFLDRRAVVRRITHGGMGGEAAMRTVRYKWTKYLQLITAN